MCVLHLEKGRREDFSKAWHEDLGHLSIEEVEIIKAKARQIEAEDGAASITYSMLHDAIHEDIIMGEHWDDPTAMTAQTAKLLDRLTAGDVFVVRQFAKEIAAVIAYEHAMADGDMVCVIRTLDAVLQPMRDWLKFHGVDPRSL
jgi:hypothetical protein